MSNGTAATWRHTWRQSKANAMERQSKRRQETERQSKSEAEKAIGLTENGVTRDMAATGSATDSTVRRLSSQAHIITRQVVYTRRGRAATSFKELLHKVRHRENSAQFFFLIEKRKPETYTNRN